MTMTMTPTADLIADYLAGPGTIRGAIAGMSPEQLDERPDPGRWSTREVICHLADSEQAWAHRLKRVIAEDRPLLPGYDESRFVEALGYDGRDLDDELDAIELTRKQLGPLLGSIPAETWERCGVHTERGLVSLAEMVVIEVEHIAHHLRFVALKRRALGLAAEAGP